MRQPNWEIRCIAIVSLYCMTATSLTAQTMPPNKPVATVNGEHIVWGELEAILKERSGAAAQVTPEQRRELEREAVSMLIDEKIFQQFIKVNGPRVPESEITKWMADLETSLKGQGHTLKEFYAERGLTPAQFREQLIYKLQWDEYVKQHLSEADVVKYYNENRDFFDQVTVQACHIVIRFVPNASEVEKQAARAKLQAARQEIVAGKIEFGEMAKKISQCPSAARGGFIGEFPRKFALEENFAKAAFALKVDEVSDVVQTDYGMHLIKVTARRANRTTTFEKVQQEVREFASEEMRHGLLEQQRKTAKVEVHLPAVAAVKSGNP